MKTSAKAILLSTMIALGACSRNEGLKQPTEWIPKHEFMEEYRKNEAKSRWLGYADYEAENYLIYEADYELYDPESVEELYYKLYSPIWPEDVPTFVESVENKDDNKNMISDDQIDTLVKEIIAECEASTTSAGNIATTPVNLNKNELDESVNPVKVGDIYQNEAGVRIIIAQYEPERDYVMFKIGKDLTKDDINSAHVDTQTTTVDGIEVILNDNGYRLLSSN